MNLISFDEEDKYGLLSGIYEVVNIKTNMRYIGQTKMPFKKRYWHHDWMLKNNRHDNKNLQREYNEYGPENFKFNVLRVADKQEDFDLIEKEYISKYTKLGLCYNIQPGGKDVDLHQYISKESYRRVGDKNRARMIGTKLSDETRKRMSEAHMKDGGTGSKLKSNDVLEIMKMFEAGMSNDDIAAKYNVTQANIRMIRKGVTWSHITKYK